MRIKTVLLLVAPLVILFGCGEETSSDKSDTNSASQTSSEVTTLDELPSFLSEGLSPEEQAELREQILPGGDDGLSAGEKFQALLEDARAGDPVAQNSLGVMYYTGEAVSKTVTGQVLDNDPELAAGWFYRSAEQGYADAQFNLGLMYANGEGVEQDMQEAVELFKKAAEQGHVDAQNNLGALYFMGEGVERDEDKAIAWFEKAAAQGNEEAKANLEAIKAAQSN
ncbi:MAG: sel1 repeat family protein [Burkholderiales bacterium]|nr:sel1 repeat family protein [Nitrosomonas sp.]MCP5273406.1 sel1 repeat family protein [Burkholderiales bacterium]